MPVRVRIKSAGWLLIGGIAIVLICVAGVAFVRNTYIKREVSLPSFAAQGFSPKSHVTTGPTNLDKDLMAAASPTLQNPGFDIGWEPVPAPQPGQPSKVTGNFPKGWFNLSVWSDLDVNFDEDKSNAHSGSSLKIDIGDVRREAVLVAQPLKLVKGKTYTVSIWVQASKPNTPVHFGLRMRGKPYRYYGSKEADAGPTWQKVETEATITDDKYPFVYLLAEMYQSNTTIWLDDAKIEEKS